jgi:hypothetical protein
MAPRPGQATTGARSKDRSDDIETPVTTGRLEWHESGPVCRGPIFARGGRECAQGRCALTTIFPGRIVKWRHCFVSRYSRQFTKLAKGEFGLGSLRRTPNRRLENAGRNRAPTRSSRADLCDFLCATDRRPHLTRDSPRRFAGCGNSTANGRDRTIVGFP